MKARNKFSPRVQYLAFEGVSRTQKHFRDQVDINNIMKKYRKTGIIEHVKRAQERYGDMIDLADYGIHLDKVAKAQQAFESLPAELRNHFKNNIPGFFEFVQDEKNRDQCIKWGIFKPQEPEVGNPTSAKPAEPAPQATKSGAIKKSPKISEPSSGDEA